MITIKQLSIFLENKNGRINDVAKVLAKEGINMQAFSMAETADFGILRLIVSDVEKAVNALRTSDFAVMLTDVVCIQCPQHSRARSPQFSTTSLPKISLSNTCMHSPKERRHEQSFVPPI